MHTTKKVIGVIGAGFAGLSAATVLGAAGFETHVFEKNATPGGRARQFHRDGFMFDMGPSWYWMPDVFERFFRRFGAHPSDFYETRLLNPGFQIIFDTNDTVTVPADWIEILELFESLEPGSARRLEKFMEEAEFKYSVGVQDIVYQPCISWTEFLRLDLLKGLFRLQLLSSFSRHLREYFSHPKLLALMEFPVLFLGAKPQNTPALYSMMNYAGLRQGTYYPMGGFGSVINGITSLAENYGVTIHQSEPVQKIEVNNNKVHSLVTSQRKISVDGIIGAADYHHIETCLLPTSHQNYPEHYWASKTFAPSCLLFYIGVRKSLPKLLHHNLFFDADLDAHLADIYDYQRLPAKPLFYVCCPSKTDPDVAPEGMENLFFLMPISAGAEDTQEIRQHYYEVMMSRVEQYVGEQFRSQIIVQESYCVRDFVQDYNAYKGNAYGLAATLRQTAYFRPSMRNKKISNLFYAGQLTVPGPGVPPALISGQVAAEQLLRFYHHPIL